MKKLASSFLAVAALLVAGVLPARAQEEAPNLVSVGTLSVAPSQTQQFAEIVGKVVEAATMSNLDAKHAWSVYQDGNDFHVVTWPENWAQLDDQGAFVREIGAGEGAELMQEAFAEFEDLWVTSSSQMAVHVDDWSYEPEDGLMAGDHTGAVIFQTWVRPGMSEEYGENTAAVMALFKEMGYPYPIYGHRVAMGDENLTYFVVLHDGLGDFYGAKSIGQLLEASGLGERWGELFEARGQLIYNNDSYQVGWRQDMSYLPDEGS
jgi:hypothetical protein